MESGSPFLYKNLSAHENLRFYGSLYEIEGLEEEIARLLERVGLAAHRDDRVGIFSRGMLQRLSLARAIINDPSILFLDEPYNGLDQEGMEILKALLEEYREMGKTVIMTSHDVDRSLEVCTRVALLQGGRLVLHEPMSGLIREKIKCFYSGPSGERSTAMGKHPQSQRTLKVGL